MNKISQFNIFYIITAVIGVYMLHNIWMQTQTVVVIPYSQFQSLLETGKIEEISITTDKISGMTKGVVTLSPPGSNEIWPPHSISTMSNMPVISKTDFLRRCWAGA